MNVSRKSLVLLITAWMIIFSSPVFPQNNNGKKTVRLTEAKVKEFRLSLGTAGPGKLNLQIKLPGKVKLNADRLVRLVPRVSGIVRQVKKKLGDLVKKAEALAVLDTREVSELVIEFLNAKTRVEMAKAELADTAAKAELAEINLKIAREKLKWREQVSVNTKTLLKRLEEKPSSDEVAGEFKGKTIGKNKALLLRAYGRLIFDKYALNREKSLRKDNVTSETDYQQAVKDYGAAKSDFEAVTEEVGFDDHYELMDIRQKAAVAQQEFKIAGLDTEVARQIVRAAQSSVNSTEHKLHILGLTDQDIWHLEEGIIQDDEVAGHLIRAPFEGTVIEKHIVPGQKIKADTEIFLLGDLRNVWVDFQAYQKDLAFVRLGQRVVITAGEGVRDTVGKIAYLEPLIKEDTRTALVRVVLPNPEGKWRPGMFVTGRVMEEDLKASLVIPKTALQTIQDKKVVFVRVAKGVFEIKQVGVGRSDQKQVEIIYGLAPGDRYVLKDGFILKAEWQNQRGE